MFLQTVFAILILSVFSGTVANFKKAKDTCITQKNITALCYYDLSENKLKNPECGQDLKRSEICETTFKDCYVCQENEKDCKGLQQNDTYPQICYLCWIKSPAKSSNYSDFQWCIETETNKLSATHISGLLVLVLMLATLI